MATAATMTELEAVNLMLSVIGEAPVNSLTSTGLGDVATARAILVETSREVQDDGWHFNQEDDVTLPLTVEGFINVPATAMRVEKMATEEADFTLRGTQLYNRYLHSYVFTSAVSVQITYFLEFDQLPQAARFYIAIRAARKFQRRSLTSTDVEKFSEREEYDALANLQDQDTAAGDFNMLTNSWDVMNIWIR